MSRAPEAFHTEVGVVVSKPTADGPIRAFGVVGIVSFKALKMGDQRVLEAFRAIDETRVA
jgi:hypothetical protein